MDNTKSRLFAACFAMTAHCVTVQAFADETPMPAATVVAPAPPVPAADKGPSPITLRLQYTGEAAYNAAGGLRAGGSYANQILGQLHIDTDKAFGWTGGRFVLEGYYENNTSLSEHYVGSFQDPSLIDTGGVALFRLYQAYYKQDFGNTNVLFGIYDLETEFGITRPMDIFFNGAYAWTFTLDQSGLNGPSTYPNTSLALRVRQKLNEHWSVQAAVLDGVPDSVKDPRANSIILNKTNGALLIAELDYTPTRTTKLMAGYWYYTGEFDAINQVDISGLQRTVFGSSGGYIGGATRLYSQTARRGLDGFVNIGFAGARTNVVDGSLNIGLTYTGLFDERPNDRLGIAAGVIRASNAYKDMQIAAGEGVKSYEANFELTWRAPINSWLTVQPDIQYFINPGLNPALKNDLLFMLHFEIAHVFGL